MFLKGDTSMEIKILEQCKPTKTIVASAMSCSSKKIVHPSEVKDVALVRDLLASGRTTTLEHTYVTFLIKGVSRHLIWSLLHSHPFYNSEQVSQRHTPMTIDNVYIPPSIGAEEEKRDFFIQHIQRCFSDYDELVGSLTPLMEELYFERHKNRKKSKSFSKIPLRLALETAQYVIPVCMTAHLYHTVNLLTLLRYRAIAADPECREEAPEIVTRMWDALLKVDPELRGIMTDVPISTSRIADLDHYDPDRADSFIETFDRVFMGTRRRSHLIDVSPHSAVMLEMYGGTTIAGFDKRNHPDETMAELIMSPIRAEPGRLNLDPISKAGQLARQVRYSFAKRISLSGDSQNQRHRTTPSASPLLMNQLGSKSTFEIPGPIYRAGGSIERRFRSSVESSIAAANEMAQWHTANPNAALYLLPNAFHARFTESADLMAMRHKCHMRLCLNTQEEIWETTKEEVDQISRIHPEIGSNLVPSCVTRYRGGLKPPCPKGKQFCGVQVYRKLTDEIERTY